MPDRLLTLAETAQRLSITYARAAEMARLGLLPVVRLGRQIRVCPERLASWIANGGEPLPGGWRKTAQ
jgi:hypothetical protein